MGSTTTLGIIETAIPLEQQLSWHLTTNHYPPVPTAMVAVCVDVIRWLADEDNDATEEFELPEGTSWRGNNFAPAYAIAEGHHLDPFIAVEARGHGEEW